MTEYILYGIESSMLLVLFYLLYVVALSKETFFQFNRIFLLAIPVLALLFPLLRVDFESPGTVVVEGPVEEISKLRKSYYEAMAVWEFESRAKGVSSPTGTKTEFTIVPYESIKLLSILMLLIYASGVALCLSRTVWTIRWISKMISRHSAEERAGVKIIKLIQPMTPFSFLNFVFVHAPVVDTSDFDQILEHERTHIREKHSIDLLFVQLLAALLWFNPVIWRLIKSLKTTHEYIADANIIRSGYSVVEYQTLLLRQLISNNSYGLVHNFNLSFIKNRIAMMKNKKSGWSGKIKIVLTILAMIACSGIIMQCNSKLDEQFTDSPVYAQDSEAAIDLPVLPPSGFRFDGDLTKAVTFTIVDDGLQIDGKQAQVADILLLEGEDAGRTLPIIMMVDSEQKMGFVRKVNMALRKSDRRKLLYLGKAATNDRVEFMQVLPPDPEKLALPDVTAIPAEHLLKIEIGKNEGVLNQKKVYDFVTSHQTKGEANLGVVSARMNDNDTYGNFLTNVFYIKEGYVQLYQERSHRMFGKDYYSTTKEEYQAVRENIPTNISISED